MSQGVNEATLKGRRGIRINPDKASVADIIRNEAAIQGFSLGLIATLAGIDKKRFYDMLIGNIGISEYELGMVEKVLGIEIARSKLTPTKYMLTKQKEIGGRVEC